MSRAEATALAYSCQQFLVEVSLEIKEKAKELPFQLDDDETENAKHQLISQDLEEILERLTTGKRARSLADFCGSRN